MNEDDTLAPQWHHSRIVKITSTERVHYIDTEDGRYYEVEKADGVTPRLGERVSALISNRCWVRCLLIGEREVRQDQYARTYTPGGLMRPND